MADGMPGMPWKEALKRLKDFHAAGADGSPASMQKELEGLEESLKGWETRDERRDRTLEVYRQTDEKLRAENLGLKKRVEAMEKAIELSVPVLQNNADEFLRKAALDASLACAEALREKQKCGHEILFAATDGWKGKPCLACGEYPKKAPLPITVMCAACGHAHPPKMNSCTKSMP